jgi:hypothetical protein
MLASSSGKDIGLSRRRSRVRIPLRVRWGVRWKAVLEVCDPRFSLTQTELWNWALQINQSCPRPRGKSKKSGVWPISSAVRIPDFHSARSSVRIRHGSRLERGVRPPPGATAAVRSLPWRRNASRPPIKNSLGYLAYPSGQRMLTVNQMASAFGGSIPSARTSNSGGIPERA